MAKATVKKVFTPEIKAETLRLIAEENYTLQQAADHAGCSVASIQSWKAGTPSGKKRKKSSKKLHKSKHAVKASAHSHDSFEEFVQEYWRKHKDAGDVLQLPPDIAPKAVQYVNNVLRYAYDVLHR